MFQARQRRPRRTVGGRGLRSRRWRTLQFPPASGSIQGQFDIPQVIWLGEKLHHVEVNRLLRGGQIAEAGEHDHLSLRPVLSDSST